ncbi:hypothetical protein [Burkholderia sp. Ac-20365]|uniref:hypothetical protein n=1 Tax=Burkholderia sp. Ac-20365 TaxID=2703897 RepID=UPI00197B8BC3|nr:hypothetical protein [Burkholderia sp. Ac-20365]MBN3760888.1 hypothetical protein [Burkholderia sp. Ac-20365]
MSTNDTPVAAAGMLTRLEIAARSIVAALRKRVVELGFALRWQFWDAAFFRMAYAQDRGCMAVAFGNEADERQGHPEVSRLTDARRFLNGWWCGFVTRSFDPTFTARHWQNAPAIKIWPLINQPYVDRPIAEGVDLELVLKDLSGRYEYRLSVSSRWTESSLWNAVNSPRALAFSQYHYGADAVLNGRWVGSTEV